MKCSRLSETIVPRIFSNTDISTKPGANFGAFRPLIHESVGGYTLTYEDEVLCKLAIPYQVNTDFKDKLNFLDCAVNSLSY